jgi:hypothetical protein
LYVSSIVIYSSVKITKALFFSSIFMTLRKIYVHNTQYLLEGPRKTLKALKNVALGLEFNARLVFKYARPQAYLTAAAAVADVQAVSWLGSMHPTSPLPVVSRSLK